MTLADGTPLSPALGIGAFADKTLVHAGQCTKVDPAASPAAARLRRRTAPGSGQRASMLTRFGETPKRTPPAVDGVRSGPRPG